MKLLCKTPIWNLVYPLAFGFLIPNLWYLFALSSIITIHLLILSIKDADLGEETPIYVILSYFGLLVLIYTFFEEKIPKKYIADIKYKILVKQGKRVPENWDDEELT